MRATADADARAPTRGGWKDGATARQNDDATAPTCEWWRGELTQIGWRDAAVAMLLTWRRQRNLLPKNGPVSGAQLIFYSMTSNILFRQVSIDSKRGKRLNLPRVSRKPDDDEFLIPSFKWTRLPVRVCFAIISNKAQGQSLCGPTRLDLKHACFTDGQLYVAMSKITYPSNINLFTKQDEDKIKNVVFKTVLSTN